MSHEEGTLPLTPNMRHVMEMLTHLQHVQQNMHDIRQHAEITQEEKDDVEKLTLCIGCVSLCCNELAASVLTVIKTSSCTTAQELSVEVQSLSHEIARAGKALNHLTKSGPGRTKTHRMSGKNRVGTLSKGQDDRPDSTSSTHLAAGVKVDDVI